MNGWLMGGALVAVALLAPGNRSRSDPVPVLAGLSAACFLVLVLYYLGA